MNLRILLKQFIIAMTKVLLLTLGQSLMSYLVIIIPCIKMNALQNISLRSGWQGDEKPDARPVKRQNTLCAN